MSSGQSRAARSALTLTAFAWMASPPPAVGADGGEDAAESIGAITVIAKRLDEARGSIQTQTGASTYTIDAAAIAAAPGGDNSLLNQITLQAPNVAQDSFGQFHVRGEHNGLQYRLNGIILPEGISGFGQSLDPRLIASLALITGALPAEYGLRTAGIIDLKTKSGAIDPGGTLALYGGSHGTIQPSFNYGGSSGAINYFFSGDFLRNDLGIESPDGSADPRHDHTTQYHGFGYFEDILDAQDRLSVVLSTSTGKFQIPDRAGLVPGIFNADGRPLQVDGRTTYASAALDENQREITHFAIASWQHSQAGFDVQNSLTARYSSLTFRPDPQGTLLYDGLAQHAYKQNVAFALQTDASLALGDAHTLRAGLFLQRDRSVSRTSTAVIPLDSAGNQVGDQPETIEDDNAKTEWLESLYVQDEWKLLPALTLNYGLRLDRFTAFTSQSQASPRLNLVWVAGPDTTVHAGYSRYLSPPPFELVAIETVGKFADTTAAAPSGRADLPQAETANYFDVGVQQKVSAAVTLGADSFYKRSHNLIDEGQFGAPIILTPFNYRDGRQYGIEFTANWSAGNLSAYGNLALQSATGRQIGSAQFNFSQAELDYIAAHYIPLDHEQRVTASGGISYLRQRTRLSADFLLGSGLRATQLMQDGSAIPNGDRLPYYTQINLGLSHAFDVGNGTLTLRIDVINALDKIYEIRDGTGVGVGAPQFGSRRGWFAGIAKSL